MDFSLSPDQADLRDLANRILTDSFPAERLKEVAESDSAVDLAAWKRLGDAGLIAIGLPESVGGGGYGWLESAIVLCEVGRAAAPVPALPVLVAAPALVGHADLLDGVADGSTVVTIATHEPLGDIYAPTTTVTDGKLSGLKTNVPFGMVAKRFVVTAADGLYSVEADADGVDVVRQDTTSGVPEAQVTFSNAPAIKLGGVAATEDLIRRALSAAAMITTGACQAALDLTAKYATTRHQFERQIASFQAVSQRTGDAYIDTEAVKLSAWQAAWRLANGFEADEALLTAKFWAAEGGWRVMHAAHHIHGGFGVDRDYPLHHYFLTHKQLELLWESATPTLVRLGKSLTA